MMIVYSAIAGKERGERDYNNKLFVERVGNGTRDERGGISNLYQFIVEVASPEFRHMPGQGSL